MEHGSQQGFIIADGIHAPVPMVMYNWSMRCKGHKCMPFNGGHAVRNGDAGNIGQLRKSVYLE